MIFLATYIITPLTIVLSLLLSNALFWAGKGTVAIDIVDPCWITTVVVVIVFCYVDPCWITTVVVVVVVVFSLC